MNYEDLITRFEAMDPTEAFEAAWVNEELSLAEKARLIEYLHHQSRMTLEGTARMTGATEVQISNLLALAMLEDSELEMVSNAKPPMATWFLFAISERPAIEAGVNALETTVDDDSLAIIAVYDAIKRVSGPSASERIAGIRGDTLRYLRKKGKDYGALNDTEMRFLAQIAGYEGTGKALSERQSAWLKKILLQLVDKRVISRNSSDNDEEACNEVLDALGI